MKKTTIQDITKALGVSRTTVWKVLNGHEGVSDNLRNQILAKAKELNYNFSFPQPEAQASVTDGSTINIAVAVCRPDTSIFWTTIIHRVAQELAQHNANLVYIYLPYKPTPDYVLPPTLNSSSIHGIIVLNVYNDILLRLLTDCRLPKVFLDTSSHFPPASLGGDLMLMENKDAIHRLTEHLIAQGRKKIGFIGDIDYAKSNAERYEGFCSAMYAHNQPLLPQFLLTGPIGTDTYKEEIDDALDSLSELPDAFVCANDYVGGILLQALLQRNVRIPEQVAVTGFDDNAENPLSSILTTVRVFNLDIGRRLALQILYRIDHPDAQYETIYIASELVLRESTEGVS